VSGISLAVAACLAGQRDWRRVTVGSNGARYGFSTGLVYGSINVNTFQGATILIATAQQSASDNFEVVLTGIRAQGFFNFVEVGLANGQSRFFYPDFAKGLTAFNQNIGPNTTQWDWSSLPVGYTWTAADVGAVRFIGFG
jgi:hypothetical protein